MASMTGIKVTTENLSDLIKKHFNDGSSLTNPVKENCFLLKVERKFRSGPGDCWVTSLKRDQWTTWRSAYIPAVKFPGDRTIDEHTTNLYLDVFLASILSWMERYTNLGYNSPLEGFGSKFKVVGLGYNFAIIAPFDEQE
jgi:hypothetical protein